MPEVPVPALSDERFKGLNTQEVEESRAKYGSNTIKEKEPPTFMECFKEGA